MDMAKTIGSVKVLSVNAVLLALFLSGCSRHLSPGQPTAPAIFPVPQPNLKVHWARPEFLYTDATYLTPDALVYPIRLDGTLVPPLTRYDIDNTPAVPAQFETYIIGLTSSPNHRSIYYRDGTVPYNRIGRYYVGPHGGLVLKQTLTEGDQTFSLDSMAFVGHQRFLYVIYSQINAIRLVPSRKMLVAYQFGVGGRVERLPGPPVVAATYTMAASVANPLIVVARAVTEPSTHFLYVVRPEDHYLDVYRIGPNGALMTRLAASLALGYRAGKSVFLPSGRILFITDADHACIKQYQTGSNGVPALLPGAVPGTDPVLDPHGRFLYAAAPGNHSLLCYHVSADGTLLSAGATVTHDLCSAPCVDATGRFVYALSQNPSRYEPAISQFRITGNGTLVPLQPEEVPAVGCTTLITAL